MKPLSLGTTISLFIVNSLLVLSSVPQAQSTNVTEMPAELELSENSTGASGLSSDNFSDVGKVLLRIPETGPFTGHGSLTGTGQRLFNGKLQCQDTIQQAFAVSGSRSGSTISLSFDFHPGSQTVTCPIYRGPTGAPTSATFPLPGGHAESHLTFSENSQTDDMSGSSPPSRVVHHVIKLHLACPVSVERGRFDVTVLPDEKAAQWPSSTPDNTKTRSWIEQHSTVKAPLRGLTAPDPKLPPRPRIETKDSDSKIESGLCFWLERVEVSFPSIRIFVPDEYRPGSCEHKAIYAHEHKHYGSLASIFAEYRARYRQAIEKLQTSETASGPALPTKARPIFVKTPEEGEAVVQGVIRATLQPLNAELANDARAAQAAIDTPAEERYVDSLCKHWGD